MIEPLHWRGDRATMNAFNATFVNLMGTADIGPINGQPAGLSAENMELFRQFALGMTLPPNPFRLPDDTLPDMLVPLRGDPGTGNPTAGALRFSTMVTEASGAKCIDCHRSPSGTHGGKLGGINPGDPDDAAAALLNGNKAASGSFHNDLKIPHLRNLYTKNGLLFGRSATPRDNKTGFGMSHDGSLADLFSFLTVLFFAPPGQPSGGGTDQQLRDMAAFLLAFPGDVKPSVGQNLTLPAGTPPTGPPASESLLATLIQVGNLADPARHCELVVSGRSGGRERTWYLDGGIDLGGLFTTDVAGEAQVATSDLRANAEGPLTFLCATIGSGVRLGGDRDLDTHLNGDDCAPSDPAVFGVAPEIQDLAVATTPATTLSWGDQSSSSGPGIAYEVSTGDLADLANGGLAGAAGCLAGGLGVTAFTDSRPDPAEGHGWFYLVRGRNVCGAATFGGDGGADALACAP
jgi:hypothetical protein